MQHLVLAASALLFAMPSAFAQSKDSCTTPVALDVKPGISLNIESISSEIDIVGTDQAGIRISCTLPDGEDPERVHLRAERTGDFGSIQVSGGHMNNLHVRIEVPKKTSFRLRMGAGLVKVNDITGDKDIDLHAGQVIIAQVDSTQYHSVHASVEIGDVRAAAFGG